MADGSYQPKVYKKQGGNEQVVASGGTLTMEPGAVLELSTGVTITGLGANLPGNLASGTIDLNNNLFGGRVLASGETIASGSTAPTAFFGGLFMPDGAPALGQSTVDHALYLNWASAIVTAIKCIPITLPQDLATAGGLTIELKGEVVGTASAADAAQGFDIRCWSGLGDTEMGATHPNFTTTPSWKGITLASSDLTTGPLNWTLVPQTHAARALRVYAARARYLRTS